MSQGVAACDISPSTANKHNEQHLIDDMPSATLPTTTTNASPFLLRVQDVQFLAQSDGFSILRSHLAEHYTYEYVFPPLQFYYSRANKHFLLDSATLTHRRIWRTSNAG